MLILELPYFGVRHSARKAAQISLSAWLLAVIRGGVAWKWLADRGVCNVWDGCTHLALSAGCFVVLDKSYCASDLIGKVSCKELVTQKMPCLGGCH